MAKLNESEIQEIYEAALTDSSLFSTIDVEELLEGIDEDKYENLEDYTMESINKEIFEIIKRKIVIN